MKSRAGKRSAQKPVEEAAAKPNTPGAGTEEQIVRSLQVSELRYRRLVEAGQDGILILDVRSPTGGGESSDGALQRSGERRHMLKEADGDIYGEKWGNPASQENQIGKNWSTGHPWPQLFHMPSRGPILEEPLALTLER